MKPKPPYEQPDSRLATDAEILNIFCTGPRVDRLDDIIGDAASDLDRSELMDAVSRGDDAELGLMFRHVLMGYFRNAVRHDLPAHLEAE